MDLKMMIKAHAKELGIDKIGFTTADNFAALKPSLLAQKRPVTRLALNIKISMNAYILIKFLTSHKV